MTTSAIDFRARTDAELGRLYNGMIATMTQLGMVYMRMGEFHNRDSLIAECEKLDKKIAKFRAGIDARDEEPPPGSPGLRRLRASPQAEAIRQDVLSDNARARREAVARMKGKSMLTEDDATGSAGGDVTAAPAAKKAKAKKAKAKKAAPKKVAKKAKAKKAGAAKSASGRAGSIPLDAKIKVSAKENPRRKGTEQHSRMDVLMKHDGKTVEDYLKKGERSTLNYAVAGKHVTTVGGTKSA